MNKKSCASCGISKTLDGFFKDKYAPNGYRSYCKACSSVTAKEYVTSKNGLVSRIYSSQKSNSKRRGHLPPTYTKCELKDWLYSQRKFHELYDAWRLAGFYKENTPSIDRKDDYAGYSLGNIQLMTWGENRKKACVDIVNCVNNKTHVAVESTNIKTMETAEYASISKASKVTGAQGTKISACCKGKRKTTGGYSWKRI